MIKFIYTSWRTLLLLSLTLALVFYFKEIPAVKRSSKNASQAHPQEYMKTILLQAFRPDGKIKQQLKAEHWAYRPETQQSTLEQPFLIVYQADGSHWFIHSQKGFVKQRSLGSVQSIELQKNVVLERPAMQAQTPINVYTETLHYDPNTTYAHSDAWVDIHKGSFKISGLGLRGYLNRDSLELLKDVKSTYTHP